MLVFVFDFYNVALLFACEVTENNTLCISGQHTSEYIRKTTIRLVKGDNQSAAPPAEMSPMNGK